MKHLSIALLTLTSLLVTALADVTTPEITVEQAQSLFDKRLEDAKNAYKAAEICKDLAQSENDDLIKNNLLQKEAEYIYYYAGKQTSKNKKLKYYSRGFQAALNATKLIVDENDPAKARSDELKDELASGYYWYAAHLGKWGETKGILASLGKWPTLKKYLLYIIKLDKTVHNYGGNRILGRAYMKVPIESKTKGLALLKEAYENSISQELLEQEDISLSRTMTNNVFYLEALEARNQTDDFCQLYDNIEMLNELSDEAKKILNPGSFPETLDGLDSIYSNDDLTEYAEENC